MIKYPIKCGFLLGGRPLNLREAAGRTRRQRLLGLQCRAAALSATRPGEAAAAWRPGRGTAWPGRRRQCLAARSGRGWGARFPWTREGAGGAPGSQRPRRSRPESYWREDRAALGWGQRRQRRSRRARGAPASRGATVTAAREGTRTPPACAGRAQTWPPPPNARVQTARNVSERCRKRRLLRRGAKPSHLVGMSGGPDAGGQRGFRRDNSLCVVQTCFCPHS